MKPAEYSSDFERIWDAYKLACFPASFGSKCEAFNEWVKINPQPDPDMIIEAIRMQKKDDKIRLEKKIFVPTWKHFCRYIKYRCWETVIDIAGEHEKKKQAVDELNRARKQAVPEPKLISPDINIADQFRQMLERKRTAK